MFQYKHPEHLWLALAAPAILLILTAYQFWRRRALSRLGKTTGLMPELSNVRFWAKGVLLATALGFLAVAWANPQRGLIKQQSTGKAADVFIAMDISESMLCRDVAPSRLEYTRIFAQKLVQSLEGERIGLIFFAGNAFLAVPLSTDYGFLLQSIQSASPDLLSEQGTAIATALELAEKSFDAEPGGGRAVVLITDGEDHDESALAAAKTAFKNGTQIMALGAGTPDGGPIPVGEWEGSAYKRDDKGNVVRTRLNEDLLRKIAAAGGGIALHINQSDRAIAAIKREVGNLEKRTLTTRSSNEFESWFQWFLLAALILLGLETRLSFSPRSSMLLFSVVLACSQAAVAQSTHTPLRKGDWAYDRSQYKEAERQYRIAADREMGHPQAVYNLGNALYQQGNWEVAEERYKQVADKKLPPEQRADVLHNLGDTFLKQRKYKEAVQAYEESLRQRPGDSGTKQNLQMAKKRLREEQNQQKDQNSQNSQNQQNQQKDQNSQNQQNQQNSSPQEQQQPPQDNSGQPEQDPQGQPQQPPKQPDQKEMEQRLKKEDAARLLETAVGQDDRKNARKYRANQSPSKPKDGKKDWK